MANAAPPAPVNRRQWLIRLAGAFTFLAIAAAIIAGVLVSKAKEEEARDARNPTRPNTYNVMNDKSLPPVQAKVTPSVDPDYPYQSIPSGDNKATGTFGQTIVPGAGVAIPTGAAGGAVDKALAVDNLGPNSTFFGRIYARGWNEVAQAQGVGVCYPANAAEVVEMVMSPACTVIVLTRSYRNPYTITQTMNITSRKIVVGNPLQPPRFMAKKGVHRYFDVQDGGNLDLRAFVITRPNRIPTGPGGLIYTSIASAILIRPGGNLHTVGVTFKLARQELGQTFQQTFPNLVNGVMGVTFGGYIVQLGGNYRAEGTWFTSFRPLGNTYIRSFTLGGNILTIGGQITLSGCWVVGANGYRAEIAIGSTLAVLFGNLIWNGGGIVSCNGLTAQYGAGMMITVVGGSIIDNGFQYLSCNGVIHRAGYTQWAIFGGTHIRTGYLQARAWGVGTTNIYAQTYAVTAGVLHYIGGVISSTANSFAFMGVGNTVGMNQGDLLWVAFAQGRATMAQSQYGLGFVYGIGGGSTKIIACPEGTTNLVRSQMGLGAVVYQGTGFVYLQNVTRFSNQMLTVFLGQGNNLYLGAGGAVSVLTAMRSIRLDEFRSTKNAYTVGTKGISGTKAYANNLFMSNGGFIRYISTFGGRRDRRALQDGTEAGTKPEPETTLNIEQELIDSGVGPSDPTFGPIGDPAIRNSLVSVDTAFYDFLIKKIPDPGDIVVWGPGTRSRHRMLQAPIEIGRRKKIDMHDMIYNTAERLGLSTPYVVADLRYDNSFHVENDNKTTCMVANSGSGDAMATSLTAGECQVLKYTSTVGSKRPMALLAEAMGRASPKIDQSTVMPFGMRAMSSEEDLPTSYSQRGDLTLFCRHSDLKKDSSHVNAGCNSDLQVREALRTYLKMPELPMAVSCDVVPERITSVLKEFLNFDWDDHNSPSVYSEDPTCNGWTKCTVSTSVQDPELVSTIEQGLKNVSSTVEGKAAVLSLLQQAQVTAAGTGHTPELTTCDLNLELVGGGRPLTLPAVNQPEYKPVRGAGASIGPKIDVVAPGDQTPSDKVRVGQAVTVYLTNFPDSSEINVKLITGGDATGPMVLTVSNFTDGAINAATWTVDEELCTPGRKYLYGYSKAAPAIFAFSLPFRCRK